MVEETHETLTLLDQDRLTRERKMAQESAPMQEGHEVRFSERHFAPRHAMGIEEVRDAVDALEIRRRLPPEAPLPPIAPAPAPAPHVRDDHRAALAPLVEGSLVSVEVVYRAGRGDVVEAVSESGGAQTRRLYVIQDGVARPADDIESRIDELPEPELPPEPAPAAPQQAAPEPAPAPPAEPEKKSRFSFSRKKAEEPPKEEAPPAKRKLPFGRKGKEKEEKAETAPEPKPEPAPADEKTAKRRFGFGRK